MMGGFSTLITVRRTLKLKNPKSGTCFIVNNVYFFFSFFWGNSDTKTTQWDDPRLQNSAITGPVSMGILGQMPKKIILKIFCTLNNSPCLNSGSALFQGLQTEVRVLPEEAEETSEFLLRVLLFHS